MCGCRDSRACPAAHHPVSAHKHDSPFTPGRVLFLKACLTPSFHPAILTFLKLATNRRVVLKPNTHLLLFLFIMQSQHKHLPPAGRSGPTRTLQQGPHPNSASPRTHIRKHGWLPCHTDGCNVTAICCHISAIHELL